MTKHCVIVIKKYPLRKKFIKFVAHILRKIFNYRFYYLKSGVVIPADFLLQRTSDVWELDSLLYIFIILSIIIQLVKNK